MAAVFIIKVFCLSNSGKTKRYDNLITDVTHSLICEDREKVKGKGEKDRARS